MIRIARPGAVALAALAAAAAPALAAEAPTPEELDQKARILERNAELDKEKAEADARPRSVVQAGKDGFGIRSADGAFQLKLRGYVQVDGRFFLDDEERPGTDTVVVRRARPIVEGTVFRIFNFRIMSDFGGGQSTLYDGYVEGRFAPWARLRAGKFKPPVGLERLQSATDLALIERAGPTSLVPSRDVGIQLGGELAAGRLEYAAGVFDGVVDGGVGDTAATDAKELAARLFWRPLRRPAGGAAETIDLGIGVAASRGEPEGTLASPQLPAFRTTGSQTFFSYRGDGIAAGTVRADGKRARIVPQGYLYAGRFGALFELAESEQRVRRDAVTADLAHRAWQLQLSWVLTGERNGYRGVTPQRPFDPEGGGRGAWILAARWSSFAIDDDAFPRFADPDRSARGADTASLGVSWNLAPGVRWMLDYDWTTFDGGAAAGGDRADERVLLTRFQVAF